ncbi:MAG TPA: Spy/CpxP family protein refolding chaperone [Phycisphaerae bacterium]|nr:Spy/CpxP family protein refolding chaperone [Phycisphaerae bacterium]
MKKYLLLVTMILVTVGMLGVMALGEEVRAGKPDRKPGPGGGAQLLERLVKELNLTEEQQVQVKQIWQTHAQAMQNFRKEHGEELKTLREKRKVAKESGNKEALKPLAEQMKTLNEARMELGKNLEKQLTDVLTKEQLAKAKKILRQGRPGGDREMPGVNLLRVLPTLGLDDKQKAQVKKILADAKAKAKDAETPEAKAEIRKAALDKIRTEVLTDAQRKKLAELAEKGPTDRRPMADMLRGLDLTEDQQKQIREIRKEARGKAGQADSREAKAEIMKAARQKINQQVLTAEQRDKLRKRMEEMRRRRAGGRGGKDQPSE